jgi:hypothetical protein
MASAFGHKKQQASSAIIVFVSTDLQDVGISDFGYLQRGFHAFCSVLFCFFCHWLGFFLFVFQLGTDGRLFLHFFCRILFLSREYPLQFIYMARRLAEWKGAGSRYSFFHYVLFPLFRNEHLTRDARHAGKE